MFEAYKNYRSAVILLGQFGFNAQQVADMCHAEVSAWIDSYLQSQGIKPQKTKGDTVHYHFVRQHRKEA